MSLSNELHGVHRIGIDSSAFIDYVEGGEGIEPLTDLFGRLAKGTIIGVASVTALPEILLPAMRNADRAEETAYRNLLALCEVVPVTEEIAEAALMLRANFGLKTADAFHIASALCSRCEAVITNDANHFGRVQSALSLPHAPERSLRVIVAKKV